MNLLQELSPRRLLTAHYNVMEDAEVESFLQNSAAFVGRARRAVADALAGGDKMGLRELLEATNPALGPFTVMQNELAGTLRAHARELVAEERVAEVPGSGPPVWKALR